MSNNELQTDSKEDIKSALESLAPRLMEQTKQDLVNIIAHFVKEDKATQDILFKTNVNTSELEWLPIAWFKWVVRMKSKPVEEYLRFRMKLNTSHKGERMNLMSQTIVPRIATLDDMLKQNEKRKNA